MGNGKDEYIAGLKKTVVPLLFGVLAGVICFSLYTSQPLMVINDGSAAAYLNEGVIPANLSAMLEAKGITLDNATVTTVERHKWIINNEYVIRCDSMGLGVYRSLVSEDWLLIALLLIIIQKFVYPVMHIRIERTIDWVTVAFITAFFWFISFTLLLAVMF